MSRVRVQLDSSLPGGTGWRCAASCATTLVCASADHVTRLLEGSRILRQWRDPLQALAWLEADLRGRSAESGARWVGFIAYDLGRWFEKIPERASDDLGFPLFQFALVEGAADRLSPAIAPDRPAPAAARSTFTREQYLAAVSRAIEYVRAGDVFQVNLSQRFTAELSVPPQAIYQRLLDSAPARYGGLLNFGSHALICNSPELFLRVTNDPRTGLRHVVTRPIKGTRPRTAGMEVQLRDSAKDAAELNMIVDLERNDLGRICRIGSVKVAQTRTIETHPTVFHGVATVEGTLRENVSLVDLLRATFPGGSVTGAPKIRAMEIIEELEPVRRGPYCGAIGYLDSDGTIEFNVAIRTMIATSGQIHVPVGGGIVADSDPAAEYDETLVKAQAMFDALGLSLPR